MSQRMPRSGSVSQFDSKLCESNTFPYNIGSSVVLSRNESTLRFLHQHIMSRDVDRDHSGKHDMFFFSCALTSISY